MSAVAVPKFHTVAPGCGCSIFTDKRPGHLKQCRERAAFWIYAPDGEPVPGGHVCASHGAAIHNEYQEKLGEDWPLVPVDHGDRAVPS